MICVSYGNSNMHKLTKRANCLVWTAQIIKKIYFLKTLLKKSIKKVHQTFFYEDIKSYTKSLNLPNSDPNFSNFLGIQF